MTPSSKSRRASIPISCRTAIETSHGSEADLRRRRQSSACHQAIHCAGIGAAISLVFVSLLLVGLTASSAAADPSRSARVGPDEADLRHHFECSNVATMRLLSLDEATGCARVFMRIKLSFVPGLGLDDFDKLPPREKAAVNLVGYQRYVEWHSENSAKVEALRDAPLSSSAFAANRPAVEEDAAIATRLRTQNKKE